MFLSYADCRLTCVCETAGLTPSARGFSSDMGQSSSSVRLRSADSGSCRRRRLLRPGSEPLQVNIVSSSHNLDFSSKCLQGVREDLQQHLQCNKWFIFIILNTASMSSCGIVGTALPLLAGIYTEIKLGL